MSSDKAACHCVFYCTVCDNQNNRYTLQATTPDIYLLHVSVSFQAFFKGYQQNKKSEKRSYTHSSAAYNVKYRARLQM